MATVKSNKSNSQIKGGGNAKLSSQSEQDIIDFLIYQKASKKKQKKTEQPSKNPTEHEIQRNRNRFVQDLVKSYERKKLHWQFNATASAVDGTVLDNEKVDGDPVTNADERNSGTVQGNVRIEIVEAIFSASSKNDKKGSNNNSKTKAPMKLPFKEGKRKIIVLPRSTIIAELLQEAKKKLHIKQNDLRAFVLGDSSVHETKKTQVDLLHNLAGIEDGSHVYICVDKQGASTKSGSSPSTTSSGSVEPLDNNDSQEEQQEDDPLEAVKRAYQSQSLRKQSSVSETVLVGEHPKFSDYFIKLKTISNARKKLPAASLREQVLQAIQDHQIVIICGETGCGKSTQIPQFIWEGMQASDRAANANIVVTQPRRVAATSLAQRVAMEMESTSPGQPGSVVGHHVRLDRAVSKATRILFCTVGILLRKMVAPNNNSSNSEAPLSGVSHIIVDEVHERDVNTDFLLALLRAALKRNRNLRIILMSATTSASLFVDYFSSALQSAPTVLNIPGRSFPVETKWLADCQILAKASIKHYHEHISSDSAETDLATRELDLKPVQSSPRATDTIDNSFIKKLIVSIIQQQQSTGALNKVDEGRWRSDGAILVFLPGKEEIQALFRELMNSTNDGAILGNQEVVKIYKLHSGISKNFQRLVFEPAASGTIKVILSTNIAETSVTIPDVTHVIDTGRVKESQFNPSTRIKELVTVWTSQASAKQRAGRAGRTSAGVCYRLYSEKFCKTNMLQQTPPEMLRTPLDELILQVCLLYEQRRDEQQQKDQLDRFPKGASPVKFLSNVPEPPPDDNLDSACQHLLEVGALQVVVQNSPSSSPSTHQVLYRLTPLGFHLSRLPMDVKVGKVLIVGCILECLEGALTVAASLSHPKSCFIQYFGNKSAKDTAAIEARKRLIQNGFGGESWRGGTVKGDLIAMIACYREWEKRKTQREQMLFSQSHAIDHNSMREVQELRKQYLDLLVDAGFVSSLPIRSKKESNNKTQSHNRNQFQDDALLTSCCLVAGLYPNICTLMRPRKHGPKGGRLLTKEGDLCRPHSQSFQRLRVQQAAETGKDAYAVFHSKHRHIGTTSSSLSIGTQKGPIVSNVYLSEVNFVSRFALMLFGGELKIVQNAIIVDDWLKFKVIGDNTHNNTASNSSKSATVANAVLIAVLREELDNHLTEQISGETQKSGNEKEMESSNSNHNNNSNHQWNIINVVRQLLAEE